MSDIFEQAKTLVDAFFEAIPSGDIRSDRETMTFREKEGSWGMSLPIPPDTDPAVTAVLHYVAPLIDLTPYRKANEENRFSRYNFPARAMSTRIDEAKKTISSLRQTDPKSGDSIFLFGGSEEELAALNIINKLAQEHLAKRNAGFLGAEYPDEGDAKFVRNQLRILYQLPLEALPKDKQLKKPGGGIIRQGIAERADLDHMQMKPQDWEAENSGTINFAQLARDAKLCGVRVGKQTMEKIASDLSISLDKPL
jgi:hypothetical protein